MNERQALLAIRNAVRLENLAEDVAKRVTPELRAIFDELGRQFRSMPPGNIEREIWYRQQRMRIADFFAPLNDEMRDALTEALGNEVANQMHYAESYLNSAIESPENKVAITAPQDGINVLGPSQTGNVQFTRQQLHTIAEETKVLGERMGDLFRPNLDGGGEHGKWIEQNMALIDRKVKAGFLTGMTNEQVAATLPGLGREAVRRNKAIARTALMDMSARSQEALWAANSDRVKGWEFDATMDNRVCDRCAPWDGQTQEVRGRLPTVPLHVNCRCRVLPLTATELALREEEGPQRRSVVELIEADSKEKAIELAKAKPGVVAARAYAQQVRIKGKKYWRVAEDIQRKDEPLTMGEFLRQASPATQEQVLGSAKRRRMFMEKIAGTAERPPISPDRALKEVTEWQPTVTRRPRLSMDMRLDIAKLKSQKELMKQNSEGEAHIVYGYIRGKDTRYGKAGSLYYVGIADDGGTRPFRQHRQGFHGVPVPKDPRQVRQLAVAKNRAEAERIEIALIAREGRIPIKGKAGLGTTGRRGLLNVSPGGGRGIAGQQRPESVRLKISSKHKGKQVLSATRRKISEANKGRKMSPNARARQVETMLKNKAAEYGVSYSNWQKLSANQRASAPGQARKMQMSVRAYVDELIKANELGVQVKVYRQALRHGVDPKLWNSLTQNQRRSAVSAARNGQITVKAFVDKMIGEWTGIGFSARVIQAAAKYGISPQDFASLTQLQKSKAAKLYKAGKRGAALLKGLL